MVFDFIFPLQDLFMVAESCMSTIYLDAGDLVIRDFNAKQNLQLVSYPIH